MNKIQQFIKDNELTFGGYGSELNSPCVILAGYACYLYDEFSVEKLIEGIKEDGFLDLTLEVQDELERVYRFAWWHSYKDFWKTDKAKEQYKF